VAKLALSIANRCVGRQLVFCQPQHLLRRVVRHASAVERERALFRRYVSARFWLNAGSDSASSALAALGHVTCF
jgi:hypothetical protein